VVVDNSLCAGKTYEDGSDVTPLPQSHYQLLGNTISIEPGEVMGCVTVQLTDDFFSDPKSKELHYVLPLRINTAKDSLLEGKDYTLYAVKYVNRFTGAWISHGTDDIDLNGQKTTVVREAEYLERNEIRYLTTRSMTQCNYALQTQVEADNTLKVLNANLILTYDDAGNITITTDTPDCEATGSGKWEEKAAKQAWGGKDRDQITLSYTITFNYTDGGVKKFKTIKANDILVMRDRQAKLETF
jgi:hypothetical protein